MSIKRFFQHYPIQIFLFLTAFFIRFPFFFRDYIDPDESTFILMGQSIADGHLPYAYLWDLKPPLLFYFFGAIEKIFPHSFIAIRFCGVIIIFLSALLLLKIARQLKLANGNLIALCYVLLSSEFGSLQGVMSEHFAVLFMLLGVLFLLRKKKGYDFLIAGLSFGAAIMCKLNYAYPFFLLIIIYFFFGLKKEQFQQTIIRTFILATGVLIPAVLLGLPFLISGKMDLFINSVFLAPWEYAKASHMSWLEKLKITGWVIALTALVCYFSFKLTKPENKFAVYLFSGILIGTVYTFFSSGIINGHYLVQIYPFLLLLLLGVIVPKPINLKLSWAVIIVVFLSSESLLEYYRLAKYFHNPSEYRPTYEVIKELKEKKLADDKIFFADYHIGYWLLDQYPLTKSTTHPSNLARPFLFKYYNDSNKTSLAELKYIMEDVKPEVIVTESNDLDYFADSSSENQYFTKSLKEDFENIYEDSADRIFIWERKNDQ